MTDDISGSEIALGTRIRRLVDQQIREREAADVVERATAARRSWAPWALQRPLPIGALAIGLIAIALLAVGLRFAGDGEGSRPATARANGLTYGVGITRSIDLSKATLTAMGSAVQNSGFRTETTTAYQIDDVDPTKVLVMKLVPGQTDDAGSVGLYLLLVRGSDGYLLTCRYFSDGDPLAPTVCSPST